MTSATYLKNELLWNVPLMLARLVAGAYILATLLTWSVSVMAGGAIYLVPTSYWIAGVKLNVPDHAVGDEPLVTFHRTIRKTFNANFVMEIHAIDEPPGREPCRHDGRATYQPNPLSSYSANWSQYTGGCKLVPGLYRIQNVIEFAVVESQKQVVVTSNDFCVYPKGYTRSWCSDRDGAGGGA